MEVFLTRVLAEWDQCGQEDPSRDKVTESKGEGRGAQSELGVHQNSKGFALCADSKITVREGKAKRTE